MRSVHADTFNHDHEADGYDDDVHDESHPVRAGYQATLDWVVARAAVQPGDAVIDLGIGTGNLSARLPACRRLVGVDVSARMLELAARKLSPRAELVQSDVLEALAGDDRFDVVISTYAIHHLDRRGEGGAGVRRRVEAWSPVAGSSWATSWWPAAPPSRECRPGCGTEMSTRCSTRSSPGSSTRRSLRWPPPASPGWRPSSSASCHGGWRRAGP